MLRYNRGRQASVLGGVAVALICSGCPRPIQRVDACPVGTLLLNDPALGKRCVSGETAALLNCLQNGSDAPAVRFQVATSLLDQQGRKFDAEHLVNLAANDPERMQRTIAQCFDLGKETHANVPEMATRVTAITADEVRPGICTEVPLNCSAQREGWQQLPPYLTRGRFRNAHCVTPSGVCSLRQEGEHVVGILVEGPCRPLMSATFCGNEVENHEIAYEQRPDGAVTFRAPYNLDSISVEHVDKKGASSANFREWLARGAATLDGSWATLRPAFFTDDVVLTLSAKCKPDGCGDGYFELPGGERDNFASLPKIHRLIAAKDSPTLGWTINLSNGSSFHFLVSTKKGDFTCDVTLPPSKMGNYADPKVCEP